MTAARLPRAQNDSGGVCRAGGSARKNAGGPGGRAGRAGWRAFGGELALGVDADLRQHLPPAGPAGISAEWMHRANRSVVIPTC